MEKKQLTEAEKLLELNRYKILRRALALECFDDDMSINQNPDETVMVNRKLANAGFDIINPYYKLSKLTNTVDELNEISAQVLEKLDEIFDKIGREKFTFYDYGHVEYDTWVNLPKKKK